MSKLQNLKENKIKDLISMLRPISNEYVDKLIQLSDELGSQSVWIFVEKEMKRIKRKNGTLDDNIITRILITAYHNYSAVSFVKQMFGNNPK